MARAARHPGNLPAEASSFVGRRREMAELKTKLAHARLVSLVGPGGVGKTRLAVRAAADLARGFADGAWLVDLAEVREPAAVLDSAIAALGLRHHGGQDALALLAGYLADRDLLLVVDNCEHVLDPATRLIDAVLASAPGVRVVATSREPLSAVGEHLLAVTPLELPPANDHEPLTRVAQTEAVSLFTERAAAATGGFELTDANRAAVAGICRRLDGLPLALELAAVKTRTLTPQQLLEHLDDRFALLGVPGRAALPRHQTLAATIDWSHGLLTVPERTLLRRLSVFAGRFTLPDAEGVCADDPHVPDRPPGDLPAGAILGTLAAIVDKSLVTADLTGPVARYRLHETMREYAMKRLAEAGEDAATEERLVAYYLARCLLATEDARLDLPTWLGWLDLEIDNLRLALRRCRDHDDGERCLALVGALAWWWITRAQAEGIRLLDDLTARYPRESSAGGAHFLRGFLAVLRFDPVTAVRELDRAVQDSRIHRSPRRLVESLAMASVAADMAGDRALAYRRLGEAQRLADELGDDVATLAATQARAMSRFFRGDLAGFRAASTEGIRLSRHLHDLYGLQIWLMNLGLAALISGEDDPQPLLTESLEIAHRIDDRVVQFYLVGALGCHAAVTGHGERGARLLGASEALRCQTGAALNAVLAPVVTQATDRLRRDLGDEAFDAEWAAGARQDRDGAVAVALDAPAVTAVAADAARWEPLTAREAEVARLVAEGLSNRQIGSRLFISERTAENHVRNIMNKLGVGSRARIAGWVAATFP